MSEKIKVYGADWCGMTKRSLALLDRLNADYEYINIENPGMEDAAQWVRDQSAGKGRKRTIRLGDRILVEPGAPKPGREGAAPWVAEPRRGKEKKPTIKIGEQILVEPSDPELEQALGNNS